MPYCHNCGHQMDENSQFCAKCGAARQDNIVSSTPDIPVPPLAPTAKKIQPVHIVIGVLGLLLCLLLAVFLIAYHTQVEPEVTAEKPADTPVEVVVLTWQEQYDLGMKYLLDGNYEEAIIAFEAAIELEPMNAQLYMDLADTYVAMDDWEMAFSVLENGYALMEDEAIALYLEQLQEAYMMKNAPDFTDLVTELETMLAFQMFAGDENFADIAVYRYDFSGDGELDWILAKDIQGAGTTGMMYTALIYSIDGGINKGTWTQYGSPGTTMHTFLYWSQSKNYIVQEEVHAGIGAGYNIHTAYDGRWTELASYERETVSWLPPESYTINGQATTQDVYDPFIESLELTYLTVSDSTLEQFEYISLEIEAKDLFYLHNTLMESPIYTYSEAVDLDGDGAIDYMLHTGDDNSAWDAAEDAVKMTYPVWYAKTMVLMSNFGNPYGYVASTEEGDSLRNAYVATSDVINLPYANSFSNASENWAQIYWDYFSVQENRPSRLQDQLVALGLEDFNFDGTPELILCGGTASAGVGIYIYAIDDDGSVYYVAGDWESGQQFGLEIGTVEDFTLLEDGEGNQFFMIDSGNGALDFYYSDTVFLTNDQGEFSPYVYASAYREAADYDDYGMPISYAGTFAKGGQAIMNEGQSLTEAEYLREMEKLDAYTVVPHDMIWLTGGWSFAEGEGLQTIRKNYNKAIGLASKNCI